MEMFTESTLDGHYLWVKITEGVEHYINVVYSQTSSNSVIATGRDDHFMPKNWFWE